MYNALWLFFAVPQWYVTTILAPFSAGPLTAIPALGVVCLIVGLVLGLMESRKGLLLFLLLPAASQGLVVVAGFMRGMLPNDGSHLYLSAFMVLQIAAAGYLVFRLRGARWAAFALSVFTVSYALFAAFVAGMSFTDVWL